MESSHDKAKLQVKQFTLEESTLLLTLLAKIRDAANSTLTQIENAYIKPTKMHNIKFLQTGIGSICIFLQL